jgi:hypothetical protein
MMVLVFTAVAMMHLLVILIRMQLVTMEPASILSIAPVFAVVIIFRMNAEIAMIRMPLDWMMNCNLDSPVVCKLLQYLQV